MRNGQNVAWIKLGSEVFTALTKSVFCFVLFF